MKIITVIERKEGGILQRRKGDEHMLKMGIIDSDVNHSNMRWLGHITLRF